eukprot:g51731.t1
MIRLQGEVMRSKVKTFAAALKLEGDPASWSKEILATNVDEATGRKLCQDAFAAQRKDREDKSLMISVNESDRLVASDDDSDYNPAGISRPMMPKWNILVTHESTIDIDVIRLDHDEAVPFQIIRLLVERNG